MKKQSYYNHWINQKGGYYLYNSLSNLVIKFKKNEINQIDELFQNLSEFQSNYLDLFKCFEKMGFIIDEDFNEIDQILFQNRQEVHIKKMYHLTINPTLECNYRCWYCCVEEEGTQYEKRRMDDKTIEKILKHIKHEIEIDKIQSLHLDWFGGEPLMYFDEVVNPISIFAKELCQKNNIPFSNHITTNAYYINNERIELFQKISLKSFQIPIDGNKKKHNSVKNMNGVGHYDQIINSINLICEKIENSHIILRINYDKNTLKTISEIINDIKECNRNKITVDFQRVWQIEKVSNKFGNNDQLLFVKKQFEGAGYSTSYYAYTPKQYKCCYSDSFYHRVINYDGKVFKCTARDYSDELSIGILNNNGIIDFKSNIIYTMFSEPTFNNSECIKCKKLPLCYGPCIQKYYESKIGKRKFQCLHESSEISFNEYVTNLAKKQIKNLKYV